MSAVFICTFVQSSQGNSVKYAKLCKNLQIIVVYKSYSHISENTENIKNKILHRSA